MKTAAGRAAIGCVPSATALAERTQAYVLRNRFRGYDPYDALESPLFTLPFLRSSKLARWGSQQVLKRLPVQVRPLLGIPRGYNPVTLALVLQGLANRRAAGVDDTAFADGAPFLVSELRRLATPGYHGACWGYDFDWQARHATIPRFHPTIVATGFVTNALYELAKVDRSSDAEELVVSAAGFVEHDLNRSDCGEDFCWSYSPTDCQQVLNASMKAVRLCAQAVDLGADPALLDLARRAARFVVAQQRPDGSWPYSVSDGRSWADSFHTGYVLDCLDAYERITGDTSIREAKERGYRFFVDRYLRTDGAVRYYCDRPYPVDASACGQALLTLSRFGDRDSTARVVAWCARHLANDDGSWRYRVHRSGTNRLVYMRWSVAWMYLGLTAVERLDAEAASA